MNKPSKSLNPIVWLTYVLLLMLPEMLMLNTHTWWDAPVSTAFNIVYYGVFAWCICALASFARPKVERAVHVLLQTVVASYSLSNVFLLVAFNRHWDAYILQFLNETNSRESSEFFSTYILSLPCLLLVAVYALLFAAEVWLARRVRRWRLFPARRVPAALAGAVCLMVLGHTAFYGSDAEANYDRVAAWHTPIKRNAMWNIWQSVLTYRGFHDEFSRCAKSLQQYNEPVSCREQQADVVLIVGESFNRHLSNLYDGVYNTNPRLKARQADGTMYVFNDVIASDNGTTQNFKQFLSPTSVDSKLAWCDAPLFPLLLRKCGYNVVFYSNQFAGTEMDKKFNASMGFFNAPNIVRHIFDHRNQQTYDYDMQLVDAYKQDQPKVDAPNRNFIILHLYGQHVKFAERYPAAYAKFKAADVKSKLPLDDEQRQEVAHYLNATYYNDYVVDSIINMFAKRNAIVLYFSDHAEEVYNFRLHVGRTDMKTDDKRALRQQLDIPFLIYMSPRYAATHTQLVKRISQSVDRPFMTDDLPQVIFDILGVNTRYYQPSRSVINSGYKPRQHRLLQVDRIYD